MNYQRKLSAGKIDSKQEQAVKELFKDIQSVLKPVKVRNPYAEALKIPEYIFKPLRTNSHYLAFIETVTFYHQYQRQFKTDPATGERYILTELEDIEHANRLIKDILLAKSDELSKAVRDFFEQLKNRLKKAAGADPKKQSFYSKEIQEHLRIYPMKVNRYLRELESRNFIRRIGGNRKKGYEYEIYRTDEYTKLQSGMNILDEILENIRKTTGRDAPAGRLNNTNKLSITKA
jgi:DNA-binding MarR family transcriptional regulator